jgi:hypothetical protein
MSRSHVDGVSVQPPDRVEHTVIHTYRDSEALGRRFFGPAYLGFLLLVLIFLFGPFAFGWSRFTWGGAAPFVAFIGLLFVHQYFVYRQQYYGRCGEIRLSDDGTCELEAERRVIRLHVNEIRSVKYSRDSEDGRVSYTINYQGGTLHVAERMTGFRDFLTRLKALTPALDLSSFPTDAWPDLGASATEPPRPARRFMRSALFPLIVICLLVYLTSHH